MSAQILITRPSSVSDADREKLHEAGIIVVETFSPSDIRLLDVEVGSHGIGGSGLLYCALKALNTWNGEVANSIRAEFARAVFVELSGQREAAKKPIRDEKGRFIKEATNA